ncbi:MAG TPA: copper homeostasis protein CutC [Bacteroidales bacterium]|nr:copper homeostasis protein CutC [Bacteroidales bacterium]
MNFKIEICVDSIESALNAQAAGADRIELCGNLLEGGTTPGYGTIESVRNNLTIDVNVIIRPRGGDFFYSDYEYDIMRREIDICGECGVNGIVLGILDPCGSVDVERTARLIECARPMSATFHRAFDMCSDPVKGLEDVIDSGADRLLTSGQKDNAQEGAEIISRLVNLAKKRIIIMPGGGINESNIVLIAKATGAKEFHSTCRKVIDSEMIFRRDGISMGAPGSQEFTRKTADPEKIANLISILRAI